MAEKYTNEGPVLDRTEVAPNGQREVVLSYPIPCKTTLKVPAFLNLVAGGFWRHGQLVFSGKNGKAEYELVGADPYLKVFRFALIHDTVSEA
jgi:hypothetical protein